MRIHGFLAVAALLTALPALAQSDSGEQDPPKKVRYIYKAVEEIDFEPVKIDGENKVPFGSQIVLRTGEKFPSQIEERVHFKRDLVKSIGVSPAKSVRSTETEVK